MSYTATLRVLIVDDEYLIRWALAETLTAAGHVPIEAGDGSAAIRAVADPVDVILLDYQLPDSSDLQLLADLRRFAPTSAIIIVTPQVTPELQDRALRLGAHRVLAKPLDMRALPALVREANMCRPI